MQRVIVVGAGVVGSASAVFLQQAGFDIAIIERDKPGYGASFGNASGLAVGEILPFATPGLLWQVPRLLLDPAGPLAIDPKHLFNCFPWLWKFLLCSTQRHVEHTASVLGWLCGRAGQDFEAYLDLVQETDLLVKRNALRLYKKERLFKKDEANWALKRRNGLAYEVVTRSELRDLEPEI